MDAYLYHGTFEVVSKPKDALASIYLGYRTCYSPDTPQEIHRQIEEGFIPRKKMIKFMEKYMNIGHTSPLEQAVWTFMFGLPISRGMIGRPGIHVVDGPESAMVSINLTAAIALYEQTEESRAYPNTTDPLAMEASMMMGFICSDEEELGPMLRKRFEDNRSLAKRLEEDPSLLSKRNWRMVGAEGVEPPTS